MNFFIKILTLNFLSVTWISDEFLVFDNTVDKGSQPTPARGTSPCHKKGAPHVSWKFRFNIGNSLLPRESWEVRGDRVSSAGGSSLRMRGTFLHSFPWRQYVVRILRNEEARVRGHPGSAELRENHSRASSQTRRRREGCRWTPIHVHQHSRTEVCGAQHRRKVPLPAGSPEAYEAALRQLPVHRTKLTETESSPQPESPGTTLRPRVFF